MCCGRLAAALSARLVQAGAAALHWPGRWGIKMGVFARPCSKFAIKTCAGPSLRGWLAAKARALLAARPAGLVGLSRPVRVVGRKGRQRCGQRRFCRAGRRGWCGRHRSGAGGQAAGGARAPGEARCCYFARYECDIGAPFRCTGRTGLAGLPPFCPACRVSRARVARFPRRLSQGRTQESRPSGQLLFGWAGWCGQLPRAAFAAALRFIAPLATAARSSGSSRAIRLWHRPGAGQARPQAAPRYRASSQVCCVAPRVSPVKPCRRRASRRAM